MVKALFTGDRVSGLYVGASNVRRYFSKRFRVIELQLDHLRIQCGLAAPFWHGQPEIHDPRLCVWLESKRPQDRLRQAEVPLAMIPSGKNFFTLAFVARNADRRARSVPARIAQTGIA